MNGLKIYTPNMQEIETYSSVSLVKGANGSISFVQAVGTDKAKEIKFNLDLPHILCTFQEATPEEVEEIQSKATLLKVFICGAIMMEARTAITPSYNNMTCYRYVNQSPAGKRVFTMLASQNVPIHIIEKVDFKSENYTVVKH